jgi:hypothetical protein
MLELVLGNRASGEQHHGNAKRRGGRGKTGTGHCSYALIKSPIGAGGCIAKGLVNRDAAQPPRKKTYLPSVGSWTGRSTSVPIKSFM